MNLTFLKDYSGLAGSDEQDSLYARDFMMGEEFEVECVKVSGDVWDFVLPNEGERIILIPRDVFTLTDPDGDAFVIAREQAARHRHLTFKGYDGVLCVKHYEEGGGQALLLVSPITGEMLCHLSRNMPDLLPGEICLRNYSENAGILRVLVDAGFAKDTGKRRESGHVTMPVVRLL